MTDPSTFSSLLVDEDARRAFEAAWHAGQPEPIERFLPPVDHPLFAGTVQELALIELELAWKAWGRAQSEDDSRTRPEGVEAYLARFPCLDRPETVLALVRQENWVRRRHGELPSTAEYHARFPALVVSGDDLALTQPVASSTTAPPSIPGYEILEELGRGGMGVVYKARDVRLKRLVALKMILAGAHATATDLERFRAEAEAVARLQHPNVVQIYEVGEHEGRPYFSLELAEGGSLRQRLAGTPQPPRASAELVRTLALAIDYAHGRGIVHRDLKPANVLLGIAEGRLQKADCSDNSAFCNLPSAIPKITDFGLAKRLEESTGPTSTGAVMGTPSYMAPEQAAGKTREIGRPVDVYALGAILYEMLTGRPPFKAESYHDTLLQVIHDEPVSPSRLLPKCPTDLETICLKCLQKEPGRRYASAAELADDLGRYLAGEPIHARPAGSVERLWRWARRNPRVAGLLTALAVVLTAGLVSVTALWALAVARGAEAEQQGRLASAERDKTRKDLLAALAAADEFYTAVSQETLIDEPGMKPLRHKLLSKARDYYAQLVERHHDDPEVRRALARAHFRIGSINHELGKGGEALAAFRTAREQYDEVRRTHPDDREVRYEQAMVVGNIAHLAYAGRPVQRLAAFQEVRQLFEELTQLDPGNADSEAMLAQALANVGTQESALGLADEAMRSHQQAFAIRARLVKHSRGGNLDLIRGLADSHDHIGGVHEMLGRDEPARQCYVKAAGIQRLLLKGKSNDTTTQNKLAISLHHLGRAQCRLGRDDEARASYGEAQRVLRELIGRDREATERRRDLGRLLRDVGKLEHGDGRNEEAVHAYREAVDLQQALHQAEPDVLDQRADLARTLTDLGAALRAKQPDEALRCGEQARAHCERLVHDSPENPDYMIDRAEALHELGRTLRRLGRSEEARAALTEAVKQQRQACEWAPQVTSCQRTLRVQLKELEAATP